MSHKRSHRGSDGAKVKHRTWQSARVQARKMSVKYGWRFDPYRCRDSECGYFHVGKYPLKELARLEFLEPELGSRVIGHLKAESWGEPRFRLKNVKKRWRTVYRRLANDEAIPQRNPTGERPQRLPGNRLP